MAEHGTAVDPRIPVLVMIDAEPDGFFIRRTDATPWAGFERAVEVMTDARVMLARRTGRDPHFTWRVRADPQVAETYGSAAWVFERHRAAFEALRAAGDEVGVHVHAYRWDARADGWVEDFGSQDWVERCVRAGVDAFTHHFGRPPTSFSMGMDWMNQATMRLVAELGLRHELSIVAGRETQPFPPRDRYTGVAPDCSGVPARPYRPSPDDFRVAAPDGRLWLIPQSSRVARVVPSWKRGLWDLLHFRPVAPRRTRKLLLEDDPEDLVPAIGAALRRGERPYVTLAIRTDHYRRPDTTAVVLRNLETAMALPEAARFAFATPDETLRLLGLVGDAPG